jgi:two-component system phosphate regulon sensor histidine kinase PhoR
LIREALDELQLQIVSASMVVRWVPADGNLTVRGDRDILVTVFTNIIDNAIKYRDREAPLLVISVGKEDRFVRIRFADNGPGIPEEYRQKIFEPFFRVPKGNKHDVKGYGLGLNYVQQAMRLHGGVGVQANAPRGTIFTLQFPAE